MGQHKRTVSEGARPASPKPRRAPQAAAARDLTPALRNGVSAPARRRAGGKPPAGLGRPSVALFQQVKDFIIGQIECGSWPPDTRVPSENDLIKALSISRMTAHRALRELASEGYLNRVQGLGTFVAAPKSQSALLTIRPISDEIAQRGATHSAEVVLLAEVTASVAVAAALGLEPGQSVYRSVIVHKADGLPVQLADRYVNPVVAPDFIRQDFTRTTPSRYLFEIGPLTRAEHIFEAILPDRRTRRLLHIGPSEPCLLLHRRTWIGEKVASKARLIHPGSRFKIGGMFTPSSTLAPTVG
jgi:GntR family histidine utilization transcriptional repressor